MGGCGSGAGGGEGELIKRGRRGRGLRHVVPSSRSRGYSGMFKSGSSSRIAAGIMVRSCELRVRMLPPDGTSSRDKMLFLTQMLILCACLMKLRAKILPLNRMSSLPQPDALLAPYL